MPRPFDDPLTHGERMVRLETVVEHLSSSHRTSLVRHDQHAEAIGRLSSRVGNQEMAMRGVYTALNQLKDVPARIAEQERRIEAKRREKEERREMRKEALALVKWGVTFLLIAGAAIGWVPEAVLKTATSALGLGK